MALLSYHRLNGNANDSMGSFNGTPTGMTYGSGIQGQSGVFNGSTSKIVLGNVMGTGYTYTWSALIKTSGSAVMLIIETRPTSEWGTALYMLANGRINLYQYYQSGGNKEYTLETTKTINDGQWHYIVAMGGVGGNGGTRRIYIDSKLEAESTGNHTNFASDLNFIIGAYNKSPWYSWNGKIEEVKIYNSLLTPIEIKNQYSYYKGFF
jgi:hypothetical protein